MRHLHQNRLDLRRARGAVVLDTDLYQTDFRDSGCYWGLKLMVND